MSAIAILISATHQVVMVKLLVCQVWISMILMLLEYPQIWTPTARRATAHLGKHKSVLLAEWRYVRSASFVWKLYKTGWNLYQVHWMILHREIHFVCCVGGIRKTVHPSVKMERPQWSGKWHCSATLHTTVATSTPLQLLTTLLLPLSVGVRTMLCSRIHLWATTKSSMKWEWALPLILLSGTATNK